MAGLTSKSSAWSISPVEVREQMKASKNCSSDNALICQALRSTIEACLVTSE
eukprot:CAMPEP_0178786388 /NCGR_PEP_ID=MMETSP0745-20121128/5289_1 /TAXON_ID=913974 /ORGANISM="Nitzschia punctata, Strain CCMP561" /LENGTH=51 /DNA_ID=CAMNT_0020444157 /DNA_START=276 /DNA_END=431 /DNA_ORIENTATION=-